ncbi:MAG: T9SS type A sorting domain-containing protein [Flavobacteriales bacterium]
MRNIIFVFLFMNLSVLAQQRFYKLYAGASFDKGEDIIVLPDSSFVVAGTSGSWEQNAQGYLLKLDQQGNYQWSQAYGTQETEEVKRLFLRPGLGYYLAGMSHNGNSGSYDPMLIFTDLSGQQQWVKSYSSPSWERIHDGTQTIDTGMVLVGERQAVFGGSADVFMMRLNKAGDTLWTKTFGSAGDDRAVAIQRLTDTTYVIGGEWYVADSLIKKAFIALVHDNGTLLWQNTFGHYSGAYQVSDLTLTPNGIMFAGFHQPNASNFDNFSGRIGPDGILIEENAQLDNSGIITNNRVCQAQYLDQQQNCIFGFQTINSSTFQDTFDLFLGYVDPYFGYWIPNLAGTVILNEGLDQINQIRATADGGYVAVGTNANVVDNQNALNGGSNIFVLKIDLLGGGEILTDTVFTLNQLVSVNGTGPELQAFQVYPNPTTGACQISTPSNETCLVHLYDQQGACLQIFEMQHQYELDLDWLTAGIYFLEVNGYFVKVLKQ